MNKIQEAIVAIHEFDGVYAKMELTRLHPLSWLLVTLVFLLTVVSFPKYDLEGVVSMYVYIIICYIYFELNLLKTIKKLSILMFFAAFVGIFNPIFDKTPMFNLGDFVVTGGILSFITLFIKGSLCLLASFLLFRLIGMNCLCYALQCLCVPAVFLTVLLLMYRYLIIFLKELNMMTQSYSLRSPRQKGINYKYWGVFVGQMLLRSLNRATEIYGAMQLRGFTGKFYLENKHNNTWHSLMFLLFWVGMFFLLRVTHVLCLIGDFFYKWLY